MELPTAIHYVQSLFYDVIIQYKVRLPSDTVGSLILFVTCGHDSDAVNTFHSRLYLAFETIVNTF